MGRLAAGFPILSGKCVGVYERAGYWVLRASRNGMAA